MNQRLRTPGPRPELGKQNRRQRLAGLLALLLFAAVATLPGRANAGTTIVVNTTADVIAEDGFCSLREAIIAANDDTAYQGCPGGSGNDTITFSSELPVPAIFVLMSPGGGADELTGDLDISGSASNTLTISGKGAAATIVDGNGSDRVFDVHGGARATLVGLTVRNGNPGAGNEGGGILVRSTGRLTVLDTVITGNSATSGGGAHVLGLFSASDSRIEMNSGGGLRNQEGLLLLENVDIGNNLQGAGVSNESGGTLQYTGGNVTQNQGGGIYNGNGTAEVADLAIVANTGGSGIHNQGTGALARLTVSHSRVLSNSATSGGGILNEGPQATATLAHTVIAANVATAGGGGVNNNGSLTVHHSTISGNQARSGGGIDHNGSLLSLTNVTVGGNGATDNGGGLHSRTNATLTNVTIAGNSASGADTGANVYVDGDSAQVTFANTIVAYPGSGGNCVNNAGAIHSSGYNLDSEQSCEFNAAGDMSNTDPLMGALDDHGGLLETYLPQAGSPAVDAGDDGACPLTDERDLPRPQDGGSGSAVCDIGAVERQPCGNPEPPSAIAPRLAGNDVELSWLPGTGAVMTNIYSGSVPYAGLASLPWRTVGATTTVHEDGFAGVPLYYALAGRDECGGESSEVARAGIFPFALVPGS